MGAVVKANTYTLCAVGLVISTLTLAAGLPVPAQQQNQQKTPAKAQAQSKAQSKAPAKGPAQDQAKDQAAAQSAASKPAKTGMAGPGKWVPADLTFSGHSCTVLVPGDYSLGEFLAPNSKLFCFKGPQHADKKSAVFNITIVASPKGSDIPGERALMDMMLNPQRSGLTGYKEQKEPIFTNGSHSFKGVSFSGQVKGGEDRRGFTYLTQDKDTFFVVFVQDEMPFADSSLPLLLKAAKGCQIK
jgi:hypothetical protein